MPWTTTVVFSSTKMLTSLLVSLCVRSAGPAVRGWAVSRPGPRPGGRRPAWWARPCSASDRWGARSARPCLGVGAVEPAARSARDVDPAERLDDPLGHLVHPGDAAEDVDEDGPDRRVGVDHLEGGGHDVGVGAAADVEEVGGGAADLVDHVEGAHGQPGTVGDDPDGAREADVVEPLLLGHALPGVLGLGGRVLLPLGVPEGGVVVEASPWRRARGPGRRGQDQRVDLGQVAVALDVAGVELRPAAPPPGPGPRRRGRPRSTHAPGGGLVEPVDRVDVQPGDGLRGSCRPPPRSRPRPRPRACRGGAWPAGRG